MDGSMNARGDYVDPGPRVDFEDGGPLAHKRGLDPKARERFYAAVCSSGPDAAQAASGGAGSKRGSGRQRAIDLATERARAAGPKVVSHAAYRVLAHIAARCKLRHGYCYDVAEAIAAALKMPPKNMARYFDDLVSAGWLADIRVPTGTGGRALRFFAMICTAEDRSGETVAILEQERRADAAAVASQVSADAIRGESHPLRTQFATLHDDGLPIRAGEGLDGPNLHHEGSNRNDEVSTRHGEGHTVKLQPNNSKGLTDPVEGGFQCSEEGEQERLSREGIVRAPGDPSADQNEAPSDECCAGHLRDGVGRVGGQPDERASGRVDTGKPSSVAQGRSKPDVDTHGHFALCAGLERSQFEGFCALVVDDPDTVAETISKLVGTEDEARHAALRYVVTRMLETSTKGQRFNSPLRYLKTAVEKKHAELRAATAGRENERANQSSRRLPYANGVLVNFQKVDAAKLEEMRNGAGATIEQVFEVVADVPRHGEAVKHINTLRQACQFVEGRIRQVMASEHGEVERTSTLRAPKSVLDLTDEDLEGWS